MSGFRVFLRKVGPCPSCGADRPVRTTSRGTQITPSCDPYRCRIARHIRLAGRWQTVIEPAPTDDRRTARQRFPGGTAA